MSLRRALHELLRNALTFAPDRSTVRVVAVDTACGVRIMVNDEGEGIDAADQERLVRPFERGTHPRQPTAGLGMGLAVASAVADSLGGRLLLSGSASGFQACLELPRERHAQARRERSGARVTGSVTRPV
ncbi:ATP-binding protein [Nocardioides sp. URHA0020]|uniref:sensor histidine kinase n=1 Tax=Nocardioides sp. URHA0020 TaxID=1380392 RepID=UPI0018CC6440